MKKPHINSTSFGSITIDGKTYDYDVIIRLDGTIEKRKKKLSKLVYGTSHKVSKDEAKHIYKKGAATIIIGSGQHGVLELSEEAKSYFQKKECNIVLLPTPEAIETWNKSNDKSIGMFHITC